MPLALSGDSSRRRPVPLTLLLILLTAAVSVASLGSGASGLTLADFADGLWGQGLDQRSGVILWDIRLPRLAMGLAVGAALAVSGALLQGLFRNPLADPGIVGVGAGSSLGAVLAIVLGGLLPPGLAVWAGVHLVPFAAFLGGLSVTLLLYAVATRAGQTSVATMLLAGIALGAIAAGVTGILIYLADDRQLRDVTFWSMGSLAGASWERIGGALPLILPALLLAPFLARGLNALALGEAQALHLGVRVQLLKRAAVFASAAATGAAVAIAGGIGFVGIVVPHLIRLVGGPDHRALLPQSALLGGSLLVLADMVARGVVAPAELPIGIVTACIGAPVFLWILLGRRGLMGL